MYQIHQPFLRTSFMISYPHPVWGIPFNNSWLMVEKTYLVWCFLTMSWPYIGEYTVIRSISAPFLRNIQHLEKLQKQITIAVTAKTLSFRMSQPKSHFGHGEGAKADGASRGRFTAMTVRESVWQRKRSAFHNSSAIVSWDQTHYFCNPLNVPRRKMWCVNLSDPRICQPLQDFHDFWLPLILNFSEASHVPYSMRPAPFATLVGAWTKAGSCQVLALSKKGNTTIVQIAWSWVLYPLMVDVERLRFSRSSNSLWVYIYCYYFYLPTLVCLDAPHDSNFKSAVSLNLQSYIVSLISLVVSLFACSYACSFVCFLFVCWLKSWFTTLIGDTIHGQNHAPVKIDKPYWNERFSTGCSADFQPNAQGIPWLYHLFCVSQNQCKGSL